MPTDFTLPELGENISAGDVLRVLVNAGDTIAKDQPVLELETDKATIEVPSSVAGQVKEIKVKAGDKVKVGQAILSVDDGAGEAAPEAEKEAAPEAEKEAALKAEKEAAPKAEKEAPPKQESAKAAEAEPEEPEEEAEPEKAESAPAGANTAAKVPADGGLEQHVEGAKRATAADKPGVKQPAADSPKTEEPETAQPRAQKVVDISRGARAAAEPAAPEAPEEPPAPAAPSVRRMARELGVEISKVPGSGPSGRISVDDVKAYAKRMLTSGAGRTGGLPSEPLPDFSRWGEIERQPMRAVRRKTAEHLSVAWATVPHVTQCDLADITALDELRKAHAKEVEAAGGNLTVTAIAVKVVAAALRRYPQFNSSIDMQAGEIIYKKYVNIGIAVDTDRGLLVPVIRNADQKNIIQLSVELAQLSEKARNRKISLEEMQGGCFSISNLGGIGGTYFTPIVNVPEVAILGISRASMQPKFSNGEFTSRLLLPLSLSYDHRAIDGADGIRFLRWVAEALEQPFLLALHG
ncbi:MAG TPA: 2-oxo acid dehydrogenase subunit E2 [Vicinamibacterales bacterium]|nr:2-oxo acid dehydrogenase subunit E2 [Vicinamibacterales bacterium]